MKECQNCYWYHTDKSYSDKVRCLNLGRKNWKGIEEQNTCDDFVLPCDFKPDPFWSMLVESVNEAIEENK